MIVLARVARSQGPSEDDYGVHRDRREGETVAQWDSLLFFFGHCQDYERKAAT